MKRNDRHRTLSNYTGLVLDARWYGLNRDLGLTHIPNGANGPTRRMYGDIELELVPYSLDYYKVNGISNKDLVAIWIDQFHFYTISYKDYDAIYTTAIATTGGHPVQMKPVMIDLINDMTNKVKQKSNFE